MEIIIWLALCALVAWFADSRGRHALAAFILSILFSPILMFIIYVVIGTKCRCPQCDEKVRKNARVCKNCGAAIPAGDWS